MPEVTGIRISGVLLTGDDAEEIEYLYNEIATKCRGSKVAAFKRMVRECAAKFQIEPPNRGEQSE